MMRALLDTNLILDVLFARQPFVEQAAVIWKAHEDQRFVAYLCGITPVTVFYIARKIVRRNQAQRMVSDLIRTFEISQINQTVLNTALTLDVSDYEDAVQIASAMFDGLDCIITRDWKDYSKSPLRVVSPQAFLAELV